MRIARTVRLGLAVAAMALPGALARADIVTYSTQVLFSGGVTPGTSTYLDPNNGIDIAFNFILNNSVSVSPGTSAQASFGTFDTTLTLTPLQNPVTSGFTLYIYQTTPTVGGPLPLVGSLSGTISIDVSHAFIQFNAPLSGALGGVIYSIASHDEDTPGRLDLVPRTTNNGLSTLEGMIGFAAVPEPSSLSALGIGCVVLVAWRRRRRVVRGG